MPLTAPSGSAYHPQLDILKGMAIVLVVAGHVLNRSPWPTPELREAAAWLVRWLYSFHIPLFFLLAGALFKPPGPGGAWPYALRRYVRLMLPFGVYALLYRLAFYPGDPGLGAGMARLYLWGNHTALAALPTQEVLWFFPCLLVLGLLALAARALLRQRPVVCLATLFAVQMAALWLWSGWDLRGLTPYYLEVALVSLWFFALGYLGRRRLAEPVPAPGRALRLVAALALSAVLAGLFATRPYESLDLLRLKLWEMPLMDLSALAGAAFCLLLAGALESGAARLAEALRLLGRASLPIFGMHMLVISAMLRWELAPLWWLRLVLGFLLALLLPWALARLLLGRWRYTRLVFLGESPA